MIIMVDTVSLVITSCDRFDLLRATLKSFFKFNTHALNQIILIEDSNKLKDVQKLISEFSQLNITVLCNEKRIGQLKSIDKAYSYVTSQYIFHCEDDWQFTAPGFIEKSLEILNFDDRVFSVYLRDSQEITSITDENRQSFKLTATGQGYFHVHDDMFSFNPGLRRLADYHMLENYASYMGKVFEQELSEFYLKKGFSSVYLNKPCVTHIGDHRRVKNPKKKVKTQFYYDVHNWLKKYKSAFYKKFKLKKFSD